MPSFPQKIDNVLFVLSPLAAEFLSSNIATNAASILKARGVSRVDLTMDPRLNLSSAHGRAYAVPEFSRAARGLSSIVFRPMLGRSDVHDLGTIALEEPPRILPDLNTLSTVGMLFTQQDKTGNDRFFRTTIEGNNLGLVFYLALHAKTPEGKSYSHVVFPGITPDAKRALGFLSADNLNVDVYGPAIDLNGPRRQMAALQPNIPKRQLN